MCLSLCVNKQDCCHWPSNNSHELHQCALHSAKVTVWSAVPSHGIIGPYCFENAVGRTVTGKTEWHEGMLETFLHNELTSSSARFVVVPTRCRNCSHNANFHASSLVPRSWKSRATSSYTSTHPLGHTGTVTASLYLIYTGCPRRNVPDFCRVFLMLQYTDITQSTYIESWTVTEIMARQKWGLLRFQILQPAQLIRHVKMVAALGGECSVHCACVTLCAVSHVTSPRGFLMYSACNPYGQLWHECECFCSSI